MPYYHGTMKRNLSSIQRHGLGGISVDPNFEGAVAGGVYLASDPAISIMVMIEHYVAAGDPDSVPRDQFDEWVIIVIDDHRIDKRFLESDPQVPTSREVWRYARPLDISGCVVLPVNDLLKSFAGETIAK